MKRYDVLFPVEPAWPRGETGVKPVEMIGSCQNKEAVVVLDSVELVQEERPVPVVDQTINVLEDNYTRSKLACLGEDFLHCSFLAHPA